MNNISTIFMLTLILTIILSLYKSPVKLEKFSEKQVRFKREICDLESKEICGSIPGIIDYPQLSYTPRNFRKF
jgi:hypothetical protein